jgi:CIC family chloride channel protein
VLALAISLAAVLFVASLRLSQRLTARLPVPAWLRPAIGGLALGAFALVLVHYVGPVLGRGDRGLGTLGGGYGGAQVAITGADWLSGGWDAVQILAVLALAKIVASSLTIGSGGSAGDFAPALAIGALVGGAFGLAARLVLDDPTIQPGAFALVGMGTFYGGIAKTPLAALVLVCEMAGSYDLLVPLMLAGGVAFIALRRIKLYPAQPRTIRESPVHRREFDRLQQLCCRDVLRERAVHAVAPETGVSELVRLVERAADQDVFPVIDAKGKLRGLLAAEALRVVASNPELNGVAVVADLMSPPVALAEGDTLRDAAKLMVAHDVRSLPVLDPAGKIVGLLDEHDISIAALDASSSSSMSLPRLGTHGR